MIKRYNARVDASYLCIFVGLNYSIQTLFSFLRLIDEHASGARESVGTKAGIRALDDP